MSRTKLKIPDPSDRFLSGEDVISTPAIVIRVVRETRWA
jgi:hypothetical protein